MKEWNKTQLIFTVLNYNRRNDFASHVLFVSFSLNSPLGERKALWCNLMILWQIIQHTHTHTPRSPHLNPHYLYECIDWRSCSTWGAEISHCSISIYCSPPSVYLHISSTYHPCMPFSTQQTRTLLGCGWSSVSASKQTRGGVRLQGFVRVFIRAVHLCANALLTLLQSPTVILFIEKQVCLGFWRLLPPSAFGDIHGAFSCRVPSKKKKTPIKHQSTFPLSSLHQHLYLQI